MTLIITTATAKEMGAVMAGCKEQRQIRTALPTTGTAHAAQINGRQCLLAVTGVGLTNAAFTLGRLLGEQTRVAGVISLGIAGTFDTEAAPLGCAVAATQETWADYGLYTRHGVAPRGIGFAQAQFADTVVWNTLMLRPADVIRQLDLAMPCHCRQGSSLTVAAASGTQKRAQAMRHAHSALMENMEGFALALGCLHQAVPFLEIRTISNITGSRKAEDWCLGKALDALGQTARALFA